MYLQYIFAINPTSIKTCYLFGMEFRRIFKTFQWIFFWTLLMNNPSYLVSKYEEISLTAKKRRTWNAHWIISAYAGQTLSRGMGSSINNVTSFFWLSDPSLSPLHIFFTKWKIFHLFRIDLNAVAKTFHMQKQNVNKKLLELSKSPVKTCNFHQLKGEILA